MDGHVASLSLTPVAEGDLPEIIALEAASYPADEAASPQALRFRAQNAPDLFRVLRSVEGRILGYVCSTAAPAGSKCLSHGSMSTHVVSGTVACVHSVVVAEANRRNGLGSAVVRMYVDELEAARKYERVLLLAKEHLVQFYVVAGGFVNNGPSAVNHGKDTWYELCKNFP
jgi:predicted N-acetyltransferase YhbS